MRRPIIRRLLSFLLAAVLLLSAHCAWAAEEIIHLLASDYPVVQDGWYSTMEEVAVYLATFDDLPGNYLTKKQAESRGWSSRKGNLDDVAPGCSIGGDRFGNYEGLLPDRKNRRWTECDIGYEGGFRGGERIVFSNDGLIYYTGDHYNSFSLIEVSFEEAVPAPQITLNPAAEIEEYGEYTSPAEVCAFLARYGQLPLNYITKAEAKEIGWSAKKDNLGTVLPGCSIGGDVYHNREKLLPAAKGRTYYECDLNTVDGRRSDERLVYSSDGLFFYSPDGLESFIQLH